MKKILIALMSISLLVGIGYSTWIITKYYSSYNTQEIIPEIGFEK